MKYFRSVALLVLIILFSPSYAETPSERATIKSVTVSLVPDVSVLDWYKRYAVLAYHKLNYKVVFKELPFGRAISLGAKGEVDAMLIRLSIIEPSMPEFIRVPVTLAEGDVYLYCQEGIVCNEDVLDDGENIIGIFSGVNATKFLMEGRGASTYEISTFERANQMFTKKRLNYLISLDKTNLGYYIAANPEKFQKIVLQKYHAFHYIHRSQKHLLPELTKALDSAVQEIGPVEQSQLMLNLQH